MKKLMSVALSAAIAAGAFIPVTSTTAEARHGRNGALAAGVFLGVLGAAALSSRRAYADDGYYYSRHRSYSRRGYCHRLADQCDEGYRRACYRYDDECR